MHSAPRHDMERMSTKEDAGVVNLSDLFWPASARIRHAARAGISI